MSVTFVRTKHVNRCQMLVNSLADRVPISKVEIPLPKSKDRVEILDTNRYIDSQIWLMPPYLLQRLQNCPVCPAMCRERRFGAAKNLLKWRYTALELEYARQNEDLEAHTNALTAFFGFFPVQ